MVRQAHHERRSEDFEKALVSVSNCSDFRGSADYSASCGGQPSTEFPLQTVSVPSNVNSYVLPPPLTGDESQL